MSTINRSRRVQNQSIYEMGSQNENPLEKGPLLTETVHELAQKCLLHFKESMPTALTIIKDYFRTSITVLPISLSLATVLAIFQAATNKSGLIYQMSFVTGALAGFVASSVTRSMSSLFQEEAVLEKNLLQRIVKTVTSPPFLGGLASSVALGVISSAGSLVFSAPLLAAGALLHYGVKNLHQQQFISKKDKEILQKSFSIAVSTLALMSPVRTTVSLVVGGALGGLIEAVCTKNKPNKPIES